MIYGINNDNNNLNNLLGTQLSEQTEAIGVTNPIGNGSVNPYENNKNYIVDESLISKNAMDLYYQYQRELDVKKFTNIAMNTDFDMERMDKLFQSGVKDPFIRFNTDKLVNNTRLLSDLDVNL